MIQGLPIVRRFGQLAVQSQSFPVVLQPAAQSRPFPDQGLMGYFCGFFARDDQPGIGQSF